MKSTKDAHGNTGKSSASKAGSPKRILVRVRKTSLDAIVLESLRRSSKAYKDSQKPGFVLQGDILF